MWEPVPEPGDIVWCLFPELPKVTPSTKPRPALVLSVDEFDDGFTLEVAFGTSNLDQMYAGDFAIRKSLNPGAYLLAGLSHDTKFKLSQVASLRWGDRYFRRAPMSPYGRHPKMGTLHISMMRALQSAIDAVRN